MSKFAIALALATVACFSSAHPAQARNYDCSKAGNANKAICKGKASAATSAAPVMAPAAAPTVMAKPRNYDCTKLGNRFRAVCRGQSAQVPAPQAATRPAMMSQPARPMGGGQMTHAGGPNGATAQCKDGSYSHSAHHSGTCSGHKGVATWY